MVIMLYTTNLLSKYKISKSKAAVLFLHPWLHCPHVNIAEGKKLKGISTGNL